MKAGYSLLWSEGSLLTQQHFQYWELMLRKEQAQLFDLWHPHAYGIQSLVIDTVALTRGMCIIHQLVARHPCGEWFIYDHETMPPLSCSLNTQGDCQVHLVVPNNAYCENLPAYNVNIPYPGYSVEFCHFDDMHHPEKKHELGIKRRNMHITSEHQEIPGTLSMVLMGLSYKGGKRYSIDEYYVPPALICSASASIMQHCSAVLELVTERSHQLMSWLAVKQDAIGMQEALILSSTTYLLQDSVQDLHPKTLYNIVSHLILNLSVLRAQSNVSQFYDHHNLMQLFSDQIATLKYLLNHVRKTASYIPILQKINEYEYEIFSMPDEYIHNGDWYLALDYSEPDLSWVSRFIKQAKIAAHEQWDTVISAALPGVTLIHAQRTPTCMLLKSGFEYFKIVKQGEYWKGVVDARSLKIHMPHPFNTCQLTIEMVTQYEKEL